MRSRFIAFFMSVLLVIPTVLFSAYADNESTQAPPFDLACESAVLMEASTGIVLYEKDPDKALPPASVTKIMTLLLVMEAVDSGRLKLTDTITASAHACSMGGSQIYLKEGEQMSAEDMIKSVVIASANDAAVALAEHIAGSEEVFVSAMNARAAELGMKNTHFENTNGLDDTAQDHVISARDIAIMSRELIKHETILKYSSTWMDSVRNGEFGLTNTNRLVRFYNGCTGLKTGSTSKAKFCISATAKRGDMSLIAVIMAAPSRDERNAAAKTLLDWGFENYAVYRSDVTLPESIRVTGGAVDSVKVKMKDFSAVVEKSSVSKITASIELPDAVAAPIGMGSALGEVVFTLDGREIGRAEIISVDKVEKIGFIGLLLEIFRYFLIKK